MTNPLIGPANLQWLGMGKEGSSTYGSPAAVPTVWIPIVSPKWAPHITPLKDQALRGTMGMTSGQVAGVRYDTIDYQTYVYLDSVFQHMMNILGGPDAVTGASDPWTHTTSLLNNANAGQPTSWTLWLANDKECWQMAGCQLSSLGVEAKVADSLMGVTASWSGLPAVKVTAPTNTPPTNKPMPAWNSLLTIGGVATSQYSDIKLTMKRDTEPVFAANQTQSPYVIFVGGLTVSGDLTAVYQGYTGTVSDLANYLTNAQPILLFQCNPAGDAVHYAKWQHSTVAYDVSAISDNGKYIEVASTLEMLNNSTDATNGVTGPQLFRLLSPVSTAY